MFVAKKIKINCYFKFFLLLDSLSYILNKIYNQNIYKNICERTVEDLSGDKLLTQKLWKM